MIAVALVAAPPRVGLAQQAPGLRLLPFSRQMDDATLAGTRIVLLLTAASD